MELPEFRDEVLSARLGRGSPRIFTTNRWVDCLLFGTTDDHLLAVLCGIVADRQCELNEPVVLLASKDPGCRQVMGYVATAVGTVAFADRRSPNRLPIVLKFDAGEQTITLPSLAINAPAELNDQAIAEERHFIPPGLASA